MATADPRRLTDQQQRAITARGVSVALSAGAGCGKTFVLTERFLSCLEPGQGHAAEAADLGQLVAITFTERAAREMRDRIRAACHQRLLAAPEKQVSYWLNLIRELDTARISTIHSFCGGLLRSHSVESGLDPQFRVLQQAEADTLRFELIDEELRGRLAARDETTMELIVQFGLERLPEMISRLLDRRPEIDWPQWLAVTPDALVARWQEVWRSDTLPRVLRQVVQSRPAATILEIARENPPKNSAMLERCGYLQEHLPRLLAGASRGARNVTPRLRSSRID